MGTIGYISSPKVMAVLWDRKNVIGDLEVLLNTPNWLIDDIIAIKIAKQICKGLEYLHGQNTAHHNLRPRNIMVLIIVSLIINSQQFL